MASVVRINIYIPKDKVVFVAQTGSPLLANECIKHGICLFPVWRRVKMCLIFMSLHEWRSVFVLSFIKMYFCQPNHWLWMLEDICLTKQADWYDFALIYISMNISLIYNKRALFFYEMRSPCLFCHDSSFIFTGRVNWLIVKHTAHYKHLKVKFG